MPQSPFIKLHPRHCIKFKTKTEQEALDFIRELKQEYIYHHIQQPSFNVTLTKRKLKPYDGEFSFYELETLKDIVEESMLKRDRRIALKSNNNINR